jgi:hypothetical protein
MDGTSQPRLLPWTGAGGKPCYLVADGNRTSRVSLVADAVESVQVGMAGDLLGHAADMLDDHDVTSAQLRFLLARMSEALTDVLRIARSRGARLPVPVHDDSDEADTDDLP